MTEMDGLINEDYIVTGPIQDLDYPKCDLSTYLEKSFRENKYKIALLDPLEGQSLTFAQVNKISDYIAGNLHMLGYNRKKSFAIYMTNCNEYVLISLAVWKLGGSVAVINSLLTVRDINTYLHLLKSEYVMCNNATVGNTTESTIGTSVKTVICKELHSGCLSFEKLCQPNDILKNIKINPINPEKDVALVAFSSGTTGTPKGVQLSHSALIMQVVYASEINGMSEVKNGSAIYQPMSHVYGVMLFLVDLAVGMKTIPMPQFDLATYLQYIEKYKLQFLCIVPPIGVLFAKSPLLKKYDLSSVETIMSGAAPLGAETEIELRQAFNNKPQVIQGYGLTESCGGVTILPKNAIFQHQGSVGLPLPRTYLKVVDIETGKNLGPGQNGEVCVKCNYLMLGYLENRVATAETIRDGWLHTGDIGFYDKQGYFFIVDRLKELLKYKGHQVSPSELENLLLTHPGIADAGVTSIPDKGAGDLPYAWIVLKPGVKLQEKEVQQFVAEHVAPYKKLRGGVKFVDAIPKSPSGKIMRRIMKQEMQSHSKL